MQDNETARTLLEQPGSEVVLLQLASMVQLVAQPQDAALEAAYHAVEALTTMTRFAEACRQLLAKGSYPGRVRATHATSNGVGFQAPVSDDSVDRVYASCSRDAGNIPIMTANCCG